jgi:AcrR family transcriptional regulator
MTKKKTETRTRILEATWRLLEQHRGQGVQMRDIAEAVGISRQALYLHFPSRAELMIATIHYVDEVKGLHERLNQLKVATTGIALLEASVDVWGNYIPEIYGLAKALLSTRDTDEATAAAWNDSMGCLRDVCREIVEAFEREGGLASGWSRDDAIDMIWTMLSIHNWEQLTIDCGWSTLKYIARMKTLLTRSLVEKTTMENQEPPKDNGLPREKW